MKKLITLLSALLLTAASVSAQTAYAIWCEGSKTLYFDYTTAAISVGGSYTGFEGQETVTEVWSGDDVLNTDAGHYGSGRDSYWVYPGWVTSAQNLIEKVVFKEPFFSASVINTNLWFLGCSNLRTLYGLSYLNLSETTSMMNMFSNCKALTSLDLSDMNASNVTSMASMFSGCSSLKDLNLSGLNTSSVTSMASMFDGCSSLTNLNLSGLNTSSVTSMASMFDGCSSLQTINLSSFNTSNVTNMLGMFESCPQLSSLNLSSFDISKVGNFSGMFSGCSSLSVIYCNSDWYKDSSVAGNGGNNIFYGCTSLKGAVAYDASKINIYMANPETGYFTYSTGAAKAIVTQDGTLYLTSSAKPVKVDDPYMGSTVVAVFTDDEVLNTGDSEPGWTNTSVKVTKVVIDESFREVHPTSTRYWFASHRTLPNGQADLLSPLKNNISSITGMEYLNTDQVTDMEGMFEGAAVEELDLSHFDTSNVTEMDYMFYYCAELASLDLSSFNTSNVTDMDSMFKRCLKLTSVNLSSFDTSKVKYMMDMFSLCTSLTSLNLSSLNTSGVESLYEMFYGCSALKELDVSAFNTSNVQVMTSMFSKCSALTELDLSGFDTSKVNYMDNMFFGCAGLKTIYCNKKWSATSSADMFYGCENLSGAVSFDASKLDVSMANPTTGYFTSTAEKDSVVYAIWCEGNKTIYFDYTNSTITSGSSYNGQKVTSVWKGDDALYGYYQNELCDVAEKIELKENFQNVTTGEYIGIFHDMHALKEIVGIQYLNTDNMTTMAQMFYQCNQLTQLDLSGFNTSKVKNMLQLFYGCGRLATLNLSGFDTSKVTDMAEMFYGCSSLTNLDLSSFNTANVTDMTNMFMHTSKLGSLDLSKFNTSKVTSMAAMFWRSGITSIDVTGFSMESVKTLESMFYGCGKLKTIYCNDTWSAASSQGMFNECTALVGAVPFDSGKTDAAMANPTTGYFTSKPTPYLVWTEANKTLRFVYTLDNITEGSTFNGQTVTKVWKGDVLNQYDLSSEEMPVAWGEQSQIAEKVVIDESFKDFRPTSTVGWFLFSGVSEIEGLSNLNTSKVENMAFMFGYCQNLTSLDLSNFDTSNVVSMTAMFVFNSQLTSVDLSGFDTSKVADMSGMFAYCSALTTLDLSHFDTSNVIGMTQMFQGCANLTELNLYSFEVPVVEEVEAMFIDCTKLKTIYCPYSWTAEYSDDMFANCLSLEGAVKFDAVNKNDVTFANPTTGYFTAEAPYAPGNVNGDKDRDGKDIIDINDVVCIINHMAGTADWLPRANVNGDKKADGSPQVDINDVVAVINIMAGK